MTEPACPEPLVTPFPGIRYAATDLTSLLCPPYDIILPAEQEALYGRDPHNVVRLELSRPEGNTDRYRTAAEHWQQWRRDGVLREDEPSLYVLRAGYTLGGRRSGFIGFFGALHLEAPDAGRVLPHEHTGSAAKADRLSLLRATRANISPVWVLYDAPSVAAQLVAASTGHPEATATTPEGVEYSLWRISAQPFVRSICDGIGDGPVTIADGHHRYETGLNYSRETMGSGVAQRYILALFVDASDPGLVILPTHRALRCPAGSDRLDRFIEKHCRVEPMSDMSALLARVNAGEHVLGMYSSGRGYVALEMLEPPLEGTTPVQLLHHRIVEPAVGTDAEINYFKDPSDAAGAVRTGGYDTAFFVRPLRSQELLAAARRVERLPRKSTYFWPKIPTGLVMRAVE